MLRQTGSCLDELRPEEEHKLAPAVLRAVEVSDSRRLGRVCSYALLQLIEEVVRNQKGLLVLLQGVDEPIREGAASLAGRVRNGLHTSRRDRLPRRHCVYTTVVGLGDLGCAATLAEEVAGKARVADQQHVLGLHVGDVALDAVAADPRGGLSCAVDWHPKAHVLQIVQLAVAGVVDEQAVIGFHALRQEPQLIDDALPRRGFVVELVDRIDTIASLQHLADHFSVAHRAVELGPGAPISVLVNTDRQQPLLADGRAIRGGHCAREPASWLAAPIWRRAAQLCAVSAWHPSPTPMVEEPVPRRPTGQDPCPDHEEREYRDPDPSALPLPDSDTRWGRGGAHVLGRPGMGFTSSRSRRLSALPRYPHHLTTGRAARLLPSDVRRRPELASTLTSKPDLVGHREVSVLRREWR